MEANLLFILEEELRAEFQSKLCLFSRTVEPLYIVIQLKSSPIGFQPMINNLKDIRKEKAKGKIDRWLNTCFSKHQKLVVKVIDESTQSNKLYLDFTGINKLNVFRSKKGEDQILPLVRNFFNTDQLNFLYFK